MGRVAISTKEQKIKFNASELNNLIQLLDKKKYGLVKKRLESKLQGSKKKSSIDGLPLSQRASEFRENRLKEPTPYELMFEEILKELGIKYEKEKIIYYDKVRAAGKSFFILDFYLPEYRVCIEIDGGYHYTDDIKKSDKLRTKILKKSNIWVIRFANETVEKHRDLTISTLKDRLEKYKGVTPDTVKFDGVIYKKRVKK